jgi:hypothetical protein
VHVVQVILVLAHSEPKCVSSHCITLFFISKLQIQTKAFFLQHYWKVYVHFEFYFSPKKIWPVEFSWDLLPV